jgi:hypothetical protein
MPQITLTLSESDFDAIIEALTAAELDTGNDLEALEYAVLREKLQKLKE